MCVLDHLQTRTPAETSGVIVDHEFSDDAAIVRVTAGRHLVLTADVISPIVDDPQTFGAIAAANSLSDVWAMGGEPRFALNLVFFPVSYTHLRAHETPEHLVCRL